MYSNLFNITFRCLCNVIKAWSRWTSLNWKHKQCLNVDREPNNLQLQITSNTFSQRRVSPPYFFACLRAHKVKPVQTMECESMPPTRASYWSITCLTHLNSVHTLIPNLIQTVSPHSFDYPIKSWTYKLWSSWLCSFFRPGVHKSEPSVKKNHNFIIILEMMTLNTLSKPMKIHSTELKKWYRRHQARRAYQQNGRFTRDLYGLSMRVFGVHKPKM